MHGYLLLDIQTKNFTLETGWPKTLNYVVFSGDGADIPAYVEPVVTAGHEFSGRVVALGEGAEEVSHHSKISC